MKRWFTGDRECVGALVILLGVIASPVAHGGEVDCDVEQRFDSVLERTRAPGWLYAPGDFDEDGRTDFAGVTIGFGGGQLTLTFANDDGTFTHGDSISVGNYVEDLAVGDVNHDGHIDLVIARSDPPEIRSWLGDGTGTFTAIAPLGGPGSPTDIELADVDGDGQVDLLVIGDSADGVSVFQGDATGMFTPGAVLAGGVVPAHLRVADVNEDGHPDVLCVDQWPQAKVYVWLNDGAGAFLDARTYPVGWVPQDLIVSDVTGDGHLDLVVLNSGLSGHVTLAGHGDGTFAFRAVFGDGFFATGGACGDLNGDGTQDLVVVDSGPPRVHILFGDGDGGFVEHQVHLAGSSLRHVFIMDVHDDGAPDVIVFDSGYREVHVLRGDGTGTFNGESFLTGSDVESVVVADLDGNGDGEVIVGRSDAPSVIIYRANAPETYVQTDAFALSPEVHHVVAGAFFGTDAIDVVAIGPFGTVTPLVNMGNGTLTPGASVELDTQFIRDVAVGDLNEDGFDDLVTGASNGAGPVVLISDGRHGFLRPEPYRFVTGVIRRVAVVDVNGDDHLDIIGVGWIGSIEESAIVFGDGEGSFGVPLPIELGPDLSDLHVHDLNGDGIPDLMILHRESGRFMTRLGLGTGGFAEPQSFDTIHVPDRIAVDDVTGDDIPDAVLISDHGRELALHIGRGDGTFGPADTMYVQPETTAVTTGDLDGDGARDVLTISDRAEAVSLHLNHCARCTTDLDGSGTVGYDDLIELLAAWGPCPMECPADVNSDAQVDFNDVLLLLATWGPCH